MARTIASFLFRWLLIFAGWTLYALFAGSQSYLSRAYSQQNVQFRPAFLYALLDSYAWALITPLILWFAGRYALQRHNWIRVVPLQLGAGILFALIHLALFVQGLPLIGYSRPAQEMFQSLFMARFHSNLLTYLVLVGLGHALNYYRKYQERELKASQLETRLAQAELQVLKMQLHPHFLFNTLHAISALMYRDVEAADRMIARLSEFLRLTLESSGVQQVSLKHELEFLERYLEIEQIRFGDRLSVEMQIDPDTLDIQVPSLILQPLVENAVRHGIAPRPDGGRIEVRSRLDNGSLRVDIEDDGPGLNAADSMNEGVGLSNTRERLRQLYGDAYTLELGPGRDGGVRVSLALPARASGAS